MHLVVTSMLGVEIRIGTDDPHLADHVAEVFADVAIAQQLSASPEHVDGEASVAVSVVHDGDEFVVQVSGGEAVRSRSGWWALAMLVWHVNQAVITIAGRARQGLLVHSGAVLRDGRTLLVLGASGAGKTTSTLAFARRGWGYVTDDVTLVDWDGRVWGSPKPPTVRTGTAALLGLETGPSRPPDDFRGGDEWWAPASVLGAHLDEGAALDGVLVLGSEPGDGICEISRGEAVGAVVRHMFDLTTAGVSELDTLARHVRRGWTAGRQDPAAVVAAITAEWGDDAAVGERTLRQVPRTPR